MRIEDSTGTGYGAAVNANHQLKVHALDIPSQEDAALNGNLTNVNTGLIAYTGTSDSSMLYLLNNESPLNGESRIQVQSLIVGIGVISATVSDTPTVTVVSNPTGGDIISDASAVDIKQSTNFSVSNTLQDTLAYKGKDGGTLTGGVDVFFAYCPQGRTAIPLNIVLERGNSLGVLINVGTSGGANAYAALVVERLDGSRD